MNKRNVTIDSLEGIGILCIIFVHFSQIFKTGQFIIFSVCGARSVQLMFVISGFLTVMSLEKYFSKQISIGDWYKKKVLRLYPSYWVFTTIFVLLVMSGVFYVNTDRWSATGIIANYLGANGLWPYYANIINLGWFFSDIVLWYLIAPVLIKLINTPSKTAGVLIVYILCYEVFAVGCDRFVEDKIVYEFLTYQWLPAQIPYLLMGILIYQLWKKNDDNQESKGVYNFAAIVILIIIVVLIRPSFINVLLNGLSFKNGSVNEYLIWGICLAVLFWAQLKNPWKVISNRLWAIWGRYSLGVYLSHYTIIKLLAAYMKNRELSFPWQINMLIYIVICVVSLGAAMAVENGISCIIRLIGVKWNSVINKGA